MLWRGRELWIKHFDPETAGRYAESQKKNGNQYTDGDAKLEQELDDWGGSDGTSSGGGGLSAV